MWRPMSSARFFRQETPCDAPWNGTVAGWQRCQHELVWLDRAVGIYALHGLRSTGGY
jgi:hypothetical protein